MHLEPPAINHAPGSWAHLFTPSQALLKASIAHADMQVERGCQASGWVLTTPSMAPSGCSFPRSTSFFASAAFWDPIQPGPCDPHRPLAQGFSSFCNLVPESLYQRTRLHPVETNALYSVTDIVSFYPVPVGSHENIKEIRVNIGIGFPKSE